MKTLLTFLTAFLLANRADAAGFSDAEVLFYGEVRQVGGAQTTLLQAGTLEITFVNRNDPSNTVTQTTSLRPTGSGDLKPYSYSLGVPLKFLPDANQKTDFLAISAQDVDFQILDITIDGRTATLPDGSEEFYSLSFASRSSQYRLDLIVGGDSTDTDTDGLPDWWESLYGLDSNLADANTDFDHDGWSNLVEFQRGSNPAVSNRDPLLATSEIIVPESGEAGLYFHVLDSDTADSGIAITLTGCAADSGFELKVDGLPLAAGESRQLPLTGLQAGRATLAHTDPAKNQAALSVAWNDGGAEKSGQVIASSVAPSTGDGSSTTLWLDGATLPADGQKIATWSDRSGFGRHAMQPLADHQPVATGRSADFSNSPSAHLFFQDPALPTGDHTILFAYHAAASSDAPQTLLATNRGHFQIAPTRQAVSYPGAPVYQMDGLSVRGFDKSSGTTATSIFRREGPLLQNVFGLSYDGESIAPTEIEPVLPTLGARRPAIPGEGNPVAENFRGQLHELLVFPIALGEQKLRDVNDYLESKWAGAVIWDQSTGLKDLVLTASPDSARRIIRGGFGNDQLAGGPLNDTLSGGGGDDRLAGGSGADRFVFGGGDTGRDRITDFDQSTDIIDLSAMFWGMSGDARSHVSIRLDANYSTPVPTLDSVLVLLRPGGGSQEIVLHNTVVSSTQLIRLIVEGRIRMGGLSIPTSLQLAASSSAVPLREFSGESFPMTLTRSGPGVPAALDVPLGFFADALGGDFIIDGAASTDGLRSVVRFARGETSKTVTVRPLPDLETEGVETWQVGVLPHFRYSAVTATVERLVSDHPMLHVEVIEANAVATPAQAARVRIYRDGDLAQSLVVDLDLGGTAVEGVHFLAMPDSITLPAGQSFVDLPLAARSEGLASGAKVVLLRLASRDRYLLGNPHEAVLYTAATAAEATTAGFDRWLSTSTGGLINSFAELVATAPESVDAQLRAYAFGLDSVQNPSPRGITLQIVDGRPELFAAGSFDAADLRWTVESSARLGSWDDVGNTFVQVPAAGGLKLVGEPLDPAADRRFYRLNLTVDPGQLAATGITALTGATRIGITGNASWATRPTTGELTASGGSPGETSRVIAETDGPASLDFEMEITGAGAGDRLVFSIDGVKHSETTGGIVRVQAEVTAPGARLMWEFKRDTGEAVIRKLSP